MSDIIYEAIRNLTLASSLVDSTHFPNAGARRPRVAQKGSPRPARAAPSDFQIDGGASVGFKIGQKVVYPNHGIGIIEQIEKKQIGAIALPFYTLRLAANNSLVLVPVSNASEVGFRAPITSGECEMLVQNTGGRFHRASERLERPF